MAEPTWPEWGGNMPSYHPWHIWTSPQGAHHAGYLLDTVVGPEVTTGQPIVYEVLRCEPCIAIHVVPLPEPDALATYYAHAFYQRDKPDYVERYERDRAWWIQAVHAPIIDRAIGALQSAGCWEDPRFLDIGAGPGLALEAARERGLETWAIEPNGRLAGALDDQGHLVLCGVFDDDTCAVLREDYCSQFHLIYLYETLEHQPCPEDLLLRCYDFLAPGGVLVVVVPNEWNALQQRAVAELHLPRWWVSPPQHLFYWSAKTLQLQLRRTGFEIRDFRSSHPIEHALFSGEIYVGNDALGRKVHERRMAYELEMMQAGRWHEVEAIYRTNLHEKNIGRELICIGQKER